jgi:hypothetical protein
LPLRRAVRAGMNEGGTPIYVTRGAQPRPTPVAGTKRSSRRGSLILVAAMFGWMLFVVLLAAIASPNDPNVEVPVDIGLGVIVTPADGWYSAAEAWDVGEGAVSLQSSGIYVAFSADAYTGTNDDLLSDMLADLKPDFESFRVLPATSTTMAGDLPALSVLISGASDNWGAESELVVATSDGVGVVMLATGPAGQLTQVQGDLDTMLDTLVVPR